MEKALREESSEEFSVTFYLDGLNPSVNVLTKIHFRNGITIFRYGPANPNIPENELSNYASMYEIYIEAKTITNTTTANLGSSGIFIIIIFLKQSKKQENSLKIYYYMQDVMTYFTIDLYPEISWM